MKEDFIELLDYNHHVNQKLIELILDNKVIISDRIQKLLNHVIDAQQIWNSRILGLESFGVWQIHDWSLLAGLDVNNYKASVEVLHGYDLKSSVMYRNSKGELFTNTVKDVLYHVVNHSTYHRAQIATDLRQNGKNL